MAAAAIDVPSYMRTVPGSINIPVAKFPAPSKTPASSDPQEVASALVENINQAVQKHDYPALARLFTDDGYWRDHLALSWVFRTVQGPSAILDFLKSAAGSKDGFRLKSISIDNSSAVRSPKTIPIDGLATVFGVQFFFKIETALGTGQGLARAVEHNGEWKIFTLYTRLQEFKGYEESINEHRPKGVEHGGKPGRKNWAQRRAAAANFEDGSEPAVLIIGKSNHMLVPKHLILTSYRCWPSWPDRRCPT